MLASDLINEAADLMLDPSMQTWDVGFWKIALNKAIATICNIKGDAYPVQGPIPLVAGTTQTIPEGQLALIDIQRNTAGKVVTLVDRELIDEENRFWPADAQQAIIDHYATDPRNPRTFFVTPPSDGTGSVDCTYGGIPDTLVNLTDPFPLLDVYHPAAICFMLAQAYAQNTKRQDLTKRQSFTQEAYNLLGTRQQNQLAVAPRVSQAQGV